MSSLPFVIEDHGHDLISIGQRLGTIADLLHGEEREFSEPQTEGLLNDLKALGEYLEAAGIALLAQTQAEIAEFAEAIKRGGLCAQAQAERAGALENDGKGE